MYTNETNILTLIALLKHHGIRKVIASPGTTNITFVGSVQQDDYFEVYSAVDERSAAYMACGLAAESGEPVVLSCTGATASRNYVPGLTEAFYRQLPVLAVTSTQHIGRVGQYIPQVIDRSEAMNDIVNLSVAIPSFNSNDDEKYYTVKLNEALLELTHNGGGPVHINLTTTYSRDYSVQKLPDVHVIDRVGYAEKLPSLTGKKVNIFVGTHTKWSDALTSTVDRFCAKYDAVVICDQTSNYRGKYRILGSLVMDYSKGCKKSDVLIHIGNVSGGPSGFPTKEVWRVNPDGVVRDTYGKLRYVFEMKELDFFHAYNELTSDNELHKNYDQWVSEDADLRLKIPELPFSNLWIAQHTANRIPENSSLYLGIWNSLRSWNYFETPNTVTGYANAGGFGIEGGISSFLGTSLADKNKLYFCVTGDLSFFYDMNAIGNRHVSNNMRLMVVNNGRGTEFHNYNHPAVAFGAESDKFMAAAGHFGNKSKTLLKNYAENLGFEYITAETKEEYLAVVEAFVDPNMHDKPMLFEVFTDSDEESEALKTIRSVEVDVQLGAKRMVSQILGEEKKNKLKKMLGK